jgi:hypothetical protein
MPDSAVGPRARPLSTARSTASSAISGPPQPHIPPRRHGPDITAAVPELRAGLTGMVIGARTRGAADEKSSHCIASHIAQAAGDRRESVSCCARGDCRSTLLIEVLSAALPLRAQRAAAPSLARPPSLPPTHPHVGGRMWGAACGGPPHAMFKRFNDRCAADAARCSLLEGMGLPISM